MLTNRLKTAGVHVLWGLVAIVFIAVVLRVWVWAPYIKTDDVYYIESAYLLASEHTLKPSHWGTRWGLIGPAALVFSIFGISDLSLGFYPFLCSLGTIYLAFLAGQRWWNRKIGLTAALLVAFFPLDVLFASHFFPAAPVAFYSGAALYATLRAVDAQSGRSFLLAGFLLGLAYTVRATALFALPPMAIIMGMGLWRLHRRMAPRLLLKHLFKALSLFALGLFIVLILEWVVMAVLTGSPFFRWQVLAGAIGLQGMDVPGAGVSLGWWFRPFVRLLTEQELVIYPLLCVPALLVQLRKPRSYPGLALALWVLFVFIYTTYGSVSLSRFAPLPRLPRYLSLLTLPALLLLAVYLHTYVSQHWRYFLLAGVAFTSIMGIYVDNGRAISSDTRQLHAFMQTTADTPFLLTLPFVFDILVYEGFPSNQSLSLYAPNARTQNQTLPYQRLAPTLRILSHDQLRAGMFVAVAPGSEEEITIQTYPGAQPIARFQPPQRVYHYLLRSRIMHYMLRATRDAYRMEALVRLGQPVQDTIVVYALP